MPDIVIGTKDSSLGISLITAVTVSIPLAAITRGTAAISSGTVGIALSTAVTRSTQQLRSTFGGTLGAESRLIADISSSASVESEHADDDQSPESIALTGTLVIINSDHQSHLHVCIIREIDQTIISYNIYDQNWISFSFESDGKE
jgi:hypothetical protein